MKLDTSSYYPKSHFDESENPDNEELILKSGQSDGSDRSDQSDQSDGSDRSDQSDRSDGSDRSDKSDSSPEPGEVREHEVPPTEFESFISSVSTAISWILVPLLMPVYGVMLAFGLSILDFTPIGVKLTYALIVLSINVLLPAVAILLLKKAGLVHDVGLNERKERSLPYLMCIICLVATGIFMQTKGAPHWLAMFYYAGAATGFVELVINQWWKISVHCAGAAGIVALLLHIQYDDFCLPATYTWIIVSIALAGLLGAARIWLGRHTLGQVLAGYAVGFCGVFFLMGL